MRRTKHMKLPNGFGQITLIKGQNLRKPYRVMITIGTNENGRPICKILKPQGYFESYNQAYMALMENLKNPYDLYKDLSVSEVYERWSKDYFKNIGQSMVNTYKLAFKRISAIHDWKIREVKVVHVKEQVLQYNSTPRVAESVHVLLNMLFDYAIENEIVDKNCSRLAKIKLDPVADENKIVHKAFTDEEMQTLIANKSDFWVKYILLQCYTGMRPGELCDIQTSNVDLEANIIVAGKKSKAGINRRIPIHPAVRELVKGFYEHAKEISSPKLLVTRQDKPLDMGSYRNAFKAACANLGMEHLSHRHG